MRVMFLLTIMVCIGGLTFAGENHARIEGYTVLSQLVSRDTMDEHLPDKCGLRVLSAALHNRSSLSPHLRSALNVVLLRPTRDTSIRVGDYRIHYDTAGANSPAMLDSLLHQRIPGTVRQYVDSVAAVLAYVTLVEANVLGYLPPPPDNGSGGGPEYDVYISELGSSYYGFTTLETPINNKPDGGTFTTFLEIDNDFQFVSPDSNKGMPGLRVTIAHELHHAIQIGNYGFWTGDTYFYEMTSVWMEDVVYTEVNDYYQYLRSDQGQFHRPDIAFTSNAFICYSRGIWGHFVSKRFGRDVMRQAWVEIQNVIPLQAMDNVLQSHQSTFRQAFSEWTLWNYFTGNRTDTVHYYPEGSFYPQVTQSSVYFTPPSSTHPNSLSALGARYHRVVGRPDTLVLALANTNLVAGLSGNTVPFPYSLNLSSYRIDDSYRPTLVDSLYLNLGVVDPANWSTQDIVRDSAGSPIVGSASVANGSAFPNPWFTNSNNPISIAVAWPANTEGELYVFTSSMDLVFSSDVKVKTHPTGKNVIEWNGKTNDGEIVRTGVFLYVLEGQSQTLTGKIAVVRK
jgi:hypothetical protein